jgi:predicted TIM-barrel fold metal-dependent hydrolase
MALSRRGFLSSALLLGAGAPLWGGLPVSGEGIIDIHQHTPYAGRTSAQLVRHQRAMGVSRTVLLPAGSEFGLGARCGRNEDVLQLAGERPEEFSFFANEVATLPEAPEEIRKYLRLGGRGIGEQKFRIACDSAEMERLAELAREFAVPMLIHFEEAHYNTGFTRFHRILEKFPGVSFIGHASTWWGHIDRNFTGQKFPTGRVTPGGLTDRWLGEYPNLFGDLSGNSGFRALIRDEEHARLFLDRHSRKLLFGSDCNDAIGRGTACTGARIIAAIRQLAPSWQVERQVLFENAKQLLKF